MGILHDLLSTAPDGEVTEVRVGLHWTAVVAEVDGQRRCGLSTTLFAEHEHGVPDIPRAGGLEALSGRELANYILSDRPTMRSVGLAALNALLPPHPEAWVDANAGDVIAEHGAGKTVALVGHFPFVPQLRESVGRLHVLELDPHPGDLPADAAPEIFPQAEVIAITAMTLLNRTFERLLGLCPPGSLVLVLGPSTPLSPLLFDYGVDLLSGSFVTAIEPVLRMIGQAACFRQVHKVGVRLVTMSHLTR